MSEQLNNSSKRKQENVNNSDDENKRLRLEPQEELPSTSLVSVSDDESDSEDQLLQNELAFALSSSSEDFETESNQEDVSFDEEIPDLIEAVILTATEEGDDNIIEIESDDELISYIAPNPSPQTPDLDSDHPLLRRNQPENNWKMLNELNRRQLGYGSKSNREAFQKKCYSSLYSVTRLQLMSKFKEHFGSVNCLNFSEDGNWLCSGSDDLKVVIWDWKTGKYVLKYTPRHRDYIYDVKFLKSTNNLQVVSCGRDGQVRLATIGKQDGLRSVKRLGTHQAACHKAATFSDQPQIILTVGEDGVVLHHDLRRGKSVKIVSLKDNDTKVALYSIKGHPLKSNEFLIAGERSVVQTYDQRMTNRPLIDYKPFKNNYKDYHASCAVYNFNGTEVLASYNNSNIYLFNQSKPKDVFHHYEGHRNHATIKEVNYFGPKSEFIVSGSDCGHIYFWEKQTEALVQWLVGDDIGVVNCLEPHPKLPFISTSGLDWTIKLWMPLNHNQPNMNELSRILTRNSNIIRKSNPNDIHENQMMWMLWRYLRNSNSSVDRANDLNSSESETDSSPEIVQYNYM